MIFDIRPSLSARATSRQWYTLHIFIKNKPYVHMNKQGVDHNQQTSGKRWSFTSLILSLFDWLFHRSNLTRKLFLFSINCAVLRTCTKCLMWAVHMYKYCYRNRLVSGNCYCRCIFMSIFILINSRLYIAEWGRWTVVTCYPWLEIFVSMVSASTFEGDLIIGGKRYQN